MGWFCFQKEYMFSFGPMLLFEWLSCYQIKENFWDQACSLTQNIIELINELHIFDRCKGNNGVWTNFLTAYFDLRMTVSIRNCISNLWFERWSNQLVFMVSLGYKKNETKKE